MAKPGDLRSTTGAVGTMSADTTAPDHQPTDLRSMRRDRLMRFQLRALARQAARVSAPVLLAAALVAVTVAGFVPWPHIAAWIAGICAMLLARWFYSRRARNVQANIARTLRVMIGLSLVNGLVTGLAAVLFLSRLPPERQAILTMIMVCWSAGAVSANAAYGKAFYAYAIPMLTPLALAWALSGSPGGAWIALLIVLFLFIQAGFVRDNERVFRQSFAIQYRNERLVGKLREERRAVIHERDRAEEANRDKSRFLYSASHDLRQPLSAILINSSVLAKSTKDEMAREVAGEIKQGAKSLKILLDALLDLSKLDAGAVKPERSRFSLEPLLSRLAAEFRPIAQSMGLNLELQCSGGVQVFTDPLWLEDILRNLVDNAIKYTEHGGVTLRATRIAGEIVLQVADTGIGIPENEQQRIFTEFYQLSNQQRDRSKGHGLGLAIVQRRIRELEIDLFLESKIGQGSTFTLRFEASDGSMLPHAIDADDVDDDDFPERLKILVVDDEKALLKPMQALLESWGCEVLLADDFDSAVTQLDDDGIDVLLTDYRLPGGHTGVDLIRTARAMHPGMSALLVSGDMAPDRQLEAKAMGIEFLHKPASEEDLRRHIAMALEEDADKEREDIQ